MKNFPIKAINPDTGKEEIFWHSRSIAVCLTVFAKNKQNAWCVLANKRGPGCPDFVGYWVCPCGYLDYNETTKEAAARECFEETGVRIPIENIQFIGYEDIVEANHQNVTFEFAGILPNAVNTSSEYNEGNETSDIRWIPIKDIYNYKWAFGHDILINANFINIIPNEDI